MSELKDRPIQIVLVSADTQYVRGAQKAFESSRVKHKIHVADFISMAMGMVYRKGAYESLPIVDLILLDLDLPDDHGFQLLQMIKSNDKLEKIPVIAMSEDDSEANITKTYSFASSNFIQKPTTGEDFEDIIHVVELCWFQAIKRMRQRKAVESVPVKQSEEKSTKPKAIGLAGLV